MGRTDGQTDRQVRQTDRQVRQTDRRTDRQGFTLNPSLGGVRYCSWA